MNPAIPKYAGSLGRALNGELSPRTASKRTLKHKLETRSRVRAVCCVMCGDTQSTLRALVPTQANAQGKHTKVYGCETCLKERGILR